MHNKAGKLVSVMDSYKEINEEFKARDIITGRKSFNILNKRELRGRELEQLLNPSAFEAESFDIGGL
jgi:hypothetical protein